MDTLFRLVSLQSSDQQSYNSSRTSSSSRSSSKPNSTHNTNNNNNNTNNNNDSSSNNCNYSYYYYHQHHLQGHGHGHLHHHHHHQADIDAYQEECGNAHHFYMDEDFSSSSSSKQFHHPYNPQNPSTTAAAPAPAPSTSSTAHLLFDPAEFSSLPPDLNLDFSSPTTSAGAGGSGGGGGGSGGGGGRWAAQLLMECARAVAARDSGRVQQLMWMLNELSSPYGEPEQKIAAYFLQGLFARLTSSGPRTLRTLSAAADRAASFESTRRTALRFQELSPWSSFGHVAANGAILEAFLEGGGAAAQRLHILDLSSTFCTQWPTLLEALATRSADDTPHLSITTVAPAPLQRVMREIGQRMEKFARLMGVPFRFAAVHPPPGPAGLADLDLESLDLRAGGAVLAVNCVGALRGVPPAPRRRDAFLAAIRRLEPRIVTVVEEEADLAAAEGDEGGGGGEEGGFVGVFKDALRFFSAYFDSLEESFPKTSNERLALERAAGRAVVDLVACPPEESAERRERAAAWSRRMRAAGFAPAAFSDDVADDVRSLLRRYREGWSMKDAAAAAGSASAYADDDAGIFLAWKDQPVVWASAWRP